MTLIRSIAAVGLAATLLACAEPLGPRGDPQIRTTQTAVEIQNDAGRTIYHAAFSAYLLPGINWVAVVDPELAIAPGSTAVVPYAAINGLSAGHPGIAVFWWYAADVNASGFVPPEKVRSTAVDAQF